MRIEPQPNYYTKNEECSSHETEIESIPILIMTNMFKKYFASTVLVVSFPFPMKSAMMC